jgi:hypothetical protein
MSAFAQDLDCQQCEWPRAEFKRCGRWKAWCGVVFLILSNGFAIATRSWVMTPHDKKAVVTGSIDVLGLKDTTKVPLG